jgi:hypothetical protein
VKNLKPWIELVDAVVSLAIKIRDARRPRVKTCEHKLFVAHRSGATEHKDDISCACGPNYQCLVCGLLWTPQSGSFSRVAQ